MTQKLQKKTASGFDKYIRNGVFIPAYLVGAFAFSIILTYFQWFKGKLHYPLSEDPAVWGQFGDFLGGVLNPICAYMAFIWLVRSFALQKSELAATRDALDKTQAAQENQAETALKAARLNAVGLQLNALNGMVTFELAEMARLSAINVYTTDKTMYNGTIRLVTELVEEKQARIMALADEQQALISKLHKIERSLN